MMYTRERLKELFEESKRRAEKKRELEKFEKNKVFLQYSSQTPNKGRKGTYYDMNRDIVTGKQNYKRHIQKIREEIEMKWKQKNLQKL